MAPPLEIAATADEASMGNFTVQKQQLELDISFSPRQIKGKTTIEILPEQTHLRDIVLNARQLRPTRTTIDGQTATFSYSNLHQRMKLYPGTGLGQYHFSKDRIKRHVDEGEEELVVHVPDTVKIREVTPEVEGPPVEPQNVSYNPVTLVIEYILDDFRDGFHFAGVEDGDSRFPHAYTRNSPFPGAASCLFPCIEDGETKFYFEVSIRYPRTVGDALSKPAAAATTARALVNGADKADSVMTDVDDEAADLSEEEKAMEMLVICSGDMTDDVSTKMHSSITQY